MSEEEREAPKLPIVDQDSDRVKAIKTGLNNYFSAVSLRNVTTEEKLAAIGRSFSEDNAELVTKSRIFRGTEEVKSFYASPGSPVMKDPNFCPSVPNLDTVCISADENTIAVEIQLTKDFLVGDWFTFDDVGRIKRMRIYS